jgi:hypothetical protein
MVGRNGNDKNAATHGNVSNRIGLGCLQDCGYMAIDTRITKGWAKRRDVRMVDGLAKHPSLGQQLQSDSMAFCFTLAPCPNHAESRRWSVLRARRSWSTNSVTAFRSPNAVFVLMASVSRVHCLQTASVPVSSHAR